MNSLSLFQKLIKIILQYLSQNLNEAISQVLPLLPNLDLLHFSDFYTYSCINKLTNQLTEDLKNNFRKKIVFKQVSLSIAFEVENEIQPSASLIETVLCHVNQ